MKAADPRPGFSTKEICLSATVVGAFLLGTLPVAAAEYLISEYYDTSDTKFSVEVISPKDRVRELAICKAVWLADEMNAKRMSLSDPVYSPPPERTEGWYTEIPADWVVLNTTAYLDDEENPAGNPSVSVDDLAAKCRQGWDWYK